MAVIMQAGLVRGLASVADQIASVAGEHPGCLACHCYRDAAEETVAALVLIDGHGELLGPRARGKNPDLAARATRLRALIDSSEGTHG